MFFFIGFLGLRCVYSMKVLLCGDYSGVHFELSKALKKKGHIVTLFSDGDAYKNLPADIKVEKKDVDRSSYPRLLLWYFLDYFGFAGLAAYLSQMRDVEFELYDVVQIINPVVVPHFGAIGNFLLLRKLKRKANRVIVCALGDDKRWVWACLRGVYAYSPLDRFRIKLAIKYYYSFKYILSPAYLLLGLYAEKISSAFITGLDDYRIAYEGLSGKTYFVRLPIDPDRYQKPVLKKATEEVVVFHAWQFGKEQRKGNDILDNAVKKAIAECGVCKVRYVVAGGLSYSEFIRTYDDADIFIDQAYSYDRGVTGALGMCSGKVVFSGFELNERYSSSVYEEVKSVGVNAIDDVDKMAAVISYLLNNSGVINEIKGNAYEYAVREYNADVISDQYVRVWEHVLENK